MRDHDDGLALANQLLEDGEDRFGGDGVEAAGRLVGGDDGRSLARARAMATLLLAAGDPAGNLRACLPPTCAQQLQGALAALLPAIEAGEVHRQEHVVEQREAGQEVEGLVMTPMFSPRHWERLLSLRRLRWTSPTSTSPRVA